MAIGSGVLLPGVAENPTFPIPGTFKAGDELACTSDGYGPTYSWSGTTGIDTDNENFDNYFPNPFTLPEGPFDLTCEAWGHVVLECIETATIVETAYSKYQTQHNTLVTLLLLITLFVG